MLALGWDVDLLAHLMTLLVTLGPAPSAAADADPVLEKAETGEAAATLFFVELSAHVEDGYAVASLQRHEDGVVVELVGPEVVVLEATTDERGRVRRTEVSSRPRLSRDVAPSAWPPEQLLAVDGLMEASVGATLSIDETADGPVLVVDDAGGRIASLQLGAIASPHFVD